MINSHLINAPHGDIAAECPTCGDEGPHAVLADDEQQCGVIVECGRCIREFTIPAEQFRTPERTDQ